MKTIRTYKYRLYPTKNQRNIIDTTLNMCRDLYNAALQERIEAYKKNRKLSRSISDVAWGKFNNFLSYKAEEAGKVYKQVNTFYPSSKVCHVCGYKNTDLKLSNRTWICQECFTEHDRDLNAALNIQREGLKQIGLGEPESKLVERSTLSSLKQEYVKQSFALTTT